MTLRSFAAILLAIGAIATSVDIRNAKCDTACLWAGYEGGFYVEAQKVGFCRCWEDRDYERSTSAKRLVIPHKKAPPKNDNYY